PPCGREQAPLPLGTASWSYCNATSEIPWIWRHLWGPINGDRRGTPFIGGPPPEKVQVPPRPPKVKRPPRAAQSPAPPPAPQASPTPTPQAPPTPAPQSAPPAAPKPAPSPGAGEGGPCARPAAGRARSCAAT